MIQVRTCLFETNSSSTHTLVMCTDKEFEKFKNGETVLSLYSELFIKPTEDIVDHDLKLDDNGYPSIDGRSYKSLDDLCYENIDEDYDWERGEVVPYWMLIEGGGFYSAEIKHKDGITAIAIEYNSEI